MPSSAVTHTQPFYVTTRTEQMRERKISTDVHS